MKEAKLNLGMRIHRAFEEMAFTQQQIAHVEVLKQTEQDRLEVGQMTDLEYEMSQIRFNEQSQQLFSRLENKSREIEQLKTLIQKGNG